MTTIRFQGTREEVRRRSLQLAAILSGRAADQHEIAKGFLLSLGFAALSDIKDAYVTKARGGTDEMGIRWPPLAPATIANRRLGPGDTRVKARPGETKGESLERIQKAELIKRRERIRKREFKKAFQRLSVSLPEMEARRRAKIVAGVKATRETGKTKVETLGGRQVEILRDTGVLLNSLGPGLLSGTSYTSPSGEGGEEHIFNLGRGEVIVGTNVVYARTHQRGDERRRIPARPFLPDETHPVPQVWWDRWVRVANKALVAGAELLFRRAA